MKLLLLISLLFVQTVAFSKAKPDSASLAKARIALAEALIKKDSIALNKLLHKKLSYGHSNGWLQNRKEVIADLYNGKLTFNTIVQSNEKFEIVRETAIVTNISDITGIYEGKEFAIKLLVLQVWAWKDKEGWRLLGRQTTKV